MLQAAGNTGSAWLKVRVSACDLLASSPDILLFEAPPPPPSATPQAASLVCLFVCFFCRNLVPIKGADNLSNPTLGK